MTETATREAKAAELEAGLAAHYCSDNYYAHWTRRLKYTDGVKYLAEKAGAYWLIDAIASYQGQKRLRTERLQEFQLWGLKVDVDHTPMAVLTCRQDTDYKPVVTQEIEYTDFPLDSIELYVEGGVLLLKSEH